MNAYFSDDDDDQHGDDWEIKIKIKKSENCEIILEKIELPKNAFFREMTRRHIRVQGDIF